MARKTVSVEWLKNKVNAYLAESGEMFDQQRVGMFVVLEAVLFETGNYKGFQYLPSEFEKPGTLRDDYDDSRRRYI